MSNGTIIITGGCGFVGSWIVKAIREQLPDFKIVVVDQQVSHSENTKDDPKLRFMEVDITDASAVLHAFHSISHPKAIVHSAGIVPTASQRYDTSSAGFSKCHAVNVVGTENVLSAAQAVGVRSLVYTSSVTVLVDDLSVDHPNMTEDLPTGFATLPYGRTKAMAEERVLAANSKDFKTCALRPSVVFGPGDTNCIPALHECIAKRETPWVIGDATASLYDFTYVTNVADAHVLALLNFMTTGTAAGHAFFITNNEPVPFRTFCMAVWAGFGHAPPFELQIPLWFAWFVGLIAEVVSWLFGVEATLSRGSVRELTMTAYASTEKARKVLGYEPKVGLAEGIGLSCEVSLMCVERMNGSNAA
jgi:sterol-4alpha-carboxylate 3-dehydrogenase (decarboxylating)